MHLGCSTARVDFKKGSGFIPALPNYPSETQPLTRAALFSALTQNICLLQEAIHFPLLIQNLEYNPTGAYEHTTEAQFITEVLNVTDVGLLLDLAHAQVSASRFGQEIKSYLATLPLERVIQPHISGPRSAGETLFDAHEPLREEDYALLAYILPKTNALVLTLEYGKDEQALLEQVSKLRKLLEAQ